MTISYDGFAVVYRPPKYDGPQVLDATVGVKFCQDTYILESFLIKQGIEYKREELEDTPLGKALIIRKKNDD